MQCTYNAISAYKTFAIDVGGSGKLSSMNFDPAFNHESKKPFCGKLVIKYQIQYIILYLWGILAIL